MGRYTEVRVPKPLLYSSGHETGALTVLRYVGSTRNKGERKYICRCTCGSEIEVRQSRIANQHGCRSCSTRKAKEKYANPGPANGNYKGTKDIPGEYFGNLRNRSRNYGTPLELTINDLQALYEQQDGKCAYTGETIRVYSGHFSKKLRARNRASLDRIDSSKGYVPGNVQWVLAEVNLMKNVLSQTDFLALVARIYETRLGNRRG